MSGKWEATSYTPFPHFLYFKFTKRTFSSNLILKEDIIGVYVPLVGDKDGVLIGLLSEESSLHNLARLFLGMGPKEPALTLEDIIDTIQEMVNILCGIVKRNLGKRQSIVATGLPIFFNRPIRLSEGQKIVSVLVEINSVPIYLIVIQRQWKTKGTV